MTRRRVLCGLLFASAVLACFAGWLWMASGPRVTMARFRRVKEGMSREEVIRTVGGPPGDYTRDGNMYKPLKGLFVGFEGWGCDDGLLLVAFDDGGTATRVVVGDNTIEPPTLTERIRRWLGL
jgi:hypothetical protein